MKKSPAALASVLCALALPAGADAAMTLGSHPDGIPEGASTGCASDCTILHDQSAGMEQRVTARGVVVRWYVRGQGGWARLQRLAVNGTMGKELAHAGGVVLNGEVQEVPTSVPVLGGDALALQLTPGASVDSADLGLGTAAITWPEGVDIFAEEPGTPTPGLAIAFQAVIEPDADADGLGDDTQDPCVSCGGGTPPPTGASPAAGDQPPEDPYAAIRTAGPRATIARKATRKGRKVSVTVTNPHAFPLDGKLRLKRGRKVVAKQALELGANATKTLKLAVEGKLRGLRAVATLRGPVGGARTTTKALVLTTADARARQGRARTPVRTR